MHERTLRFTLRGVDGRVSVYYGVNDDPLRWGFGLLGLPYDVEIARGFPVIAARMEFPAAGYAGYLGWVQGVRETADGSKEDAIPDVAPQLQGKDVPYLTFGVEPGFFDAPANTKQNVLWRAWTFLTQTPDTVMTAVVEPVCGFTWGYDVRDGVVAPTELLAATEDDWLRLRDDLRERLPGWTFGGDDWNAPSFQSERSSRR
jgi:hypothetical protein